MSMEITPVKKGEQVHFHNPVIAFYDAVGGEDGMRELTVSYTHLTLPTICSV